MERLSCSQCPHHYFCCTLKVRPTFLEILRLRLKGHQDFLEKDSQNQAVFKQVKGRCCFFRNRSCQIYSFRPKFCRQFPSPLTLPNCTYYYLPWRKHQQKIKKLLQKSG